MKISISYHNRIVIQLLVAIACALLVYKVWQGSAPARSASPYGVFDVVYFVPDIFKTFYNKLHFYESYEEHKHVIYSLVSVIAGGSYYKIAVFLRANKGFSNAWRRTIFEGLSLITAANISLISFEVLTSSYNLLVLLCSTIVIIMAELVIFRSAFQE